MSESRETKRKRWMFNLFPAYRSTGAWVEYIAGDWREIRIRLPLTWRTRNYVGTMFGGAMYAAIDPMYMMMLINLLGPDYVVWDKAADIRFRRPGRGTLRASFVLSDQVLASIRDQAHAAGKTEHNFRVELIDTEGEVAAHCDKLVYVRYLKAETHRQ